MHSKDYRRLCTKIGITVLINTLMLQFLSVIVDLACTAAEASIRNFAIIYGINANDYYYAFRESAMLLTYLASFLVPAFIFMLMTRKSGREPMRLGVRIFPNAPAVIISAMGTIVLFAYVNSFMVSFIDFSKVYVLLFSLMHGNFAQFLYTFVAGLVLGIVYIETGSIWTPTFIHLFNNFYSLIQQIVYERFGKTQRIGIILTVVDVAIILLGAMLGAWLLYFRKKKGAREGFAEPTKKVELDKKEAKLGFFRPVVIVHIVLSVLIALLIAVTAWLYTYMQ